MAFISVTEMKCLRGKKTPAVVKRGMGMLA